MLLRVQIIKTLSIYGRHNHWTWRHHFEDKVTASKYYKYANYDYLRERSVAWEGLFVLASMWSSWSLLFWNKALLCFCVDIAWGDVLTTWAEVIICITETLFTDPGFQHDVGGNMYLKTFFATEFARKKAFNVRKELITIEKSWEDYVHVVWINQGLSDMICVYHCITVESSLRLIFCTEVNTINTKED